MKNRQILAKIWQYIIDDHRIILLNGARQTGKTTLLKLIEQRLFIEKKATPAQVHWFDLEKASDLEIWSDQSLVLNRLPQEKTKQHFVFIDEFQKSKIIGSTLKVIHDHYPWIKCVVTGSASWYLGIDESMAGRKIVVPIYPLTFWEYLDWQENRTLFECFDNYLKTNNRLTASELSRLNNVFVDYLAYGGYPEVVLYSDNNKKQGLLEELNNSYLLRDIQLLNYAADPVQVQKILTLLASQITNLLDLTTLAKNTGLGRTALENRLGLLQNIFLIQISRPYFTNKKKELVKNPKIYCLDSGWRNMLLKQFDPMPKTSNFGSLAENFVFAELTKYSKITDKLFYWRTKQKQEVDIIFKREGSMIPCEIKSGNFDKIPSSLKSFIKSYQPKQAYVLNWSIIKDEQFENCLVKFRPLWSAQKIIDSE